jgi:putative hemolysin
MTSVKTYGAVGDGVTDDTAAIQAALADGRASATEDYYGRPKALYFPPGVYLVRDSLQWVGCCVLLQGAGPTTSILRLAPSSPGFGNPDQPKPLILTPATATNESFRQNIWDLGLAVGANNAGATALDYVSNNNGSIHDVLIKSEDGKGYAGIDLTRQYAGPLLIRNTEVDGFDVGVDLKNAEYSTTMEAITLVNQNIAGIRNVNQSISVRGLSSSNAVPAITNSGGFVVLLDSTLNGGSPTSVALQTDSTMYLREVTSAGYRTTLSSTMPNYVLDISGAISERLVGKPMTLTGTLSQSSLGLNIEETPSYVSTDLSDWAPFTPNSYGDTSGMQAVLNSGKPTIYFPFQSYFSYSEADVTVPDSVDRIVGFSSIVNGSTGGINGGGIRLVVTSSDTQPLVIEQFGYGMKIDHRGSRPIVIKDGNYVYYSAPGAGTLFLEDAEIDGFTVQAGQNVWARQLDDEAVGTKIENLGGSLWILGLKTENSGTVIDTAGGGKTELLGGLIYPAHPVPTTDIAFQDADAQVSYMYKESTYCAGCGYTVQIQETRTGKTRQITSSPSSGWSLPLFIGYTH